MSQTPPPMRVIPVATAYAPSMTAFRPGAVTAVGIISIILGVMGIIANLGVAGFSATTLMMARVQKMSAGVHDVRRYPLTPNVTETAPDSLPDAAATTIVAGLDRARPLTPVRARHLKSLASMHGRKLFSFDPENLTVSRVRANISESGPVLLSPGKTGDYYVTGTGRIEISDVSAIFRSDEGDTWRSGDAAVDLSVPEPQIAQAIASINANLPAPLNAAQTASVQQLLRDPNQSIVDATNVLIQQSGPLENGGAWFITDQAQVRLAGDGTPTLLSIQAPMPGMNPFTGKPIQTRWGQMLLLECLISGLLAILLLIAGIFLLRGRPIGRRLLLIYSLVKLPLAIMGAALLGLTIAQWIGAIQTPGVASNVTPNITPNVAPAIVVPAMAGAWTSAILVGLASLAWPIIVLVVMLRQNVRDYFKGVI